MSTATEAPSDLHGLAQRCLERLREGTLAEEHLRELVHQSRPRRQDLLYLQVGSTSVGAGAIGILLVIGGRLVEPPEDPAKWPYRSVLQALQDGWRVIKFPETALLAEPDRTIGLGCEFILERWS
jgi:hypothetical protein